jgi:hypothetical protein
MRAKVFKCAALELAPHFIHNSAALIEAPSEKLFAMPNYGKKMPLV